MSLIKILFLFLFSFSALALTEEEEKKYDELEGLAFLEALIKDKKYQEVIKQYPAISKDQRKMASIITHLPMLIFISKNLKSPTKSWSEETKRREKSRLQ